MTFSVSGLPYINTSSRWTDITSSKLPFLYFLNKIHESAFIIFSLNLLTKYFVNSPSHKSAASRFPYIDSPSKMQYSFRNSSLMIPKYSMTSYELDCQPPPYF